MTMPLARGACVVSIDTELAWGGAHRRDGDPAPAYDGEREAVAGILDVLAHHQVPATWAIVGHLFLDRCDRSGGRPHPEVVRPDFAWLDGDWFDVDPCSDRAEAPDYYAPDVVDAIRACPVPQEIGCHSFAHVMAGDPGCSREAFLSDLVACRAAAGDQPLRSFVYPRNSVGHVDALPAVGFTAYRGHPPAPLAGRPVLRLLDRVRPLAGSAVRPARHPSGVWDVPQTFLLAPATRRRWLPVDLWVRRPKARLRQAARERSLFHLWFHPYNVTADPPRALAALDAICAEAARLREAGRLDTLTMGGLAAAAG
jgi:hypothetical protein